MARGEIIGNAVADKREKMYHDMQIGSDYMFRVDEVRTQLFSRKKKFFFFSQRAHVVLVLLLRERRRAKELSCRGYLCVYCFGKTFSTTVGYYREQVAILLFGIPQKLILDTFFFLTSHFCCPSLCWRNQCQYLRFRPVDHKCGASVRACIIRRYLLFFTFCILWLARMCRMFFLWYFCPSKIERNPINSTTVYRRSAV